MAATEGVCSSTRVCSPMCSAWCSASSRSATTRPPPTVSGSLRWGFADEAELADAIRSGAPDDRYAEVKAAVAATVHDKLSVANPQVPLEKLGADGVGSRRRRGPSRRSSTGTSPTAGRRTRDRRLRSRLRTSQPSGARSLHTSSNSASTGIDFAPPPCGSALPPRDSLGCPARPEGLGEVARGCLERRPWPRPSSRMPAMPARCCRSRGLRSNRHSASAGPRSPPARLSEYVEICNATATSSHGASRNPPPARRRSEADCVQRAVDAAPTSRRASSGSRRRDRHRDVDSHTSGSDGAAGKRRCVKPQRDPPVSTISAPCSCAIRAAADAQRVVGEDTGHEDALAVEQTHASGPCWPSRIGARR